MELGNMIWGNSRGEFPVSRGKWQTAFIKFLENIGLDSYGYVPLWSSDELKKYQTSNGGFENNIFIINPYYWGEDENEAIKPNFIFKSTGYELKWYKYPLRDAYANAEVDFDTFVNMLNTCLNSVKQNDT